MIPQLAPAELVRWRADATREAPLLVDVREQWEFAHCRIDGSLSIPLGELPHRQAELPRERPLVMVCHHGRRSLTATFMLRAAGFTNVRSMAGGIDLWARDIDPKMATY